MEMVGSGDYMTYQGFCEIEIGGQKTNYHSVQDILRVPKRIGLNEMLSDALHIQ